MNTIDTIMALVSELADLAYNDACVGYDEKSQATKRMEETIRTAIEQAIKDEREAMQADAERYRWVRDIATSSAELRNTAAGKKYVTVWHIVTGGSEYDIDAAIDKARSET